MRAKGDERFINMLTCIRTGRTWNGISDLTAAQKGQGQNYDISDYQVLLGRCLHTLTGAKPEMAHKFKDAPIVVGEKTLQDSLNNKIVENFAKKNN